MNHILFSLLVAILPFGSVLADIPKSKNAKVTLVYQHELPNVPGKINDQQLERLVTDVRVRLPLSDRLRNEVSGPIDVDLTCVQVIHS